MEDVLVPLGVFTMITVIVWLITYFRFRGQRETQETIRTMFQSGQSVSDEQLEALVAALNPAMQDLRRGIISCAIGLGILVLALVINEREVVMPLVGVASFPFFLGIAYFYLWRLNEKKKAA